VWRSRFGADPSIIGRSLHVNGRPFTLVGIVPETFVGLDDQSAAAWIPIAQHGLAFPGSRLLDDWKGHAVLFNARLREGAAPPAAEAELRAAADVLRTQRPGDVWDGEWLAIRPAGRYVSFEEAAPGFLLSGTLVALILVAACMNLGLLVLARTLGRDREFAIRLSVGATRGRLVRQLLTEHLLLGLLGAVAGTFVALQSARVILSITGAPPGVEPAFNLRALVVAGVLALFSTLVFGFAPAWQAARPSTVRRLRLRSILVAVQVAAASALLIVSALVVRGIARVVQVPLGFNYQQTLVADPDLVSRGTTPGAAQAYWRDVEARIRPMPGVKNTAITTLPPFGNRVWINSERTVFYHVTPSYFDTLQIALTRGRIFAEGETGVAVVSDALAGRRWPGEDPVGKEFEGVTIIGTVREARTVRVGEEAATECYFAITPSRMIEAVLVARVDGAPRDAVASVRAVLRGDDGHLMPSVVPLQDALEEKLEGPRQFALVASTLGACALLLAVIGLGGMVAFTVSQRLREIGVRLALGARPGHLVRAIARQFAVPLASGAVAGSALAAGGGVVLASELFGVSAFDPLAHGGALLLFALVAAAATFPSIRRALRVDPVQTLRHE
jgi:predicted permease